MKKLLVSAVALAMIAGPVFAQTWVYTGKHPKNEPAPTRTVKPGKVAPKEAGPNDVYCNDKYLGTDPDPNVRYTILREGLQSECR